MKKHAFTLPEVLTIVAVIGIITAIAIPVFISNIQAQKAGPMLGKAVDSFQKATSEMLYEASSKSLSGGQFEVLASDGSTTSKIIESEQDFVDILSMHLKGKAGEDVLYADDGVSYSFVGLDSSVSNDFPGVTPLITRVGIDLNGDKAPNKDGMDKFNFILMNDGSLIAWGSAGDNVKDTEEHKKWSEVCPKYDGSEASIVSDARMCAGHITENGMKIGYKLPKE